MAARFGRYATDLKYVVAGMAIGNYASFYIDICAVKGKSMQPTLDGERLLVAKRNNFDLEKGSIYTFRHPNEPSKIIVKRVVGGEGDHFWGQGKAITVPTGHIWIEGDNEHMSEDSRHYGPIPSGLVIGKAHGVIWPPKKWKWLERQDVSHRQYVPPPPVDDVDDFHDIYQYDVDDSDITSPSRVVYDIDELFEEHQCDIQTDGEHEPLPAAAFDESLQSNVEHSDENRQENVSSSPVS
eukprot:TRINITY_DN1271_c3_g1_i1.p1 TRINITY_DN1271_c3_g1~~TRINITY_DN1271_c3_g1_i1.p1  ORF type:complete len:251 (+),score=51.98 TRINITY_DN1271_c3_g1_i1:37-753(+)